MNLVQHICPPLTFCSLISIFQVHIETFIILDDFLHLRYLFMLDPKDSHQVVLLLPLKILDPLLQTIPRLIFLATLLTILGQIKQIAGMLRYNSQGHLEVLLGLLIITQLSMQQTPVIIKRCIFMIKLNSFIIILDSLFILMHGFL